MSKVRAFTTVDYEIFGDGSGTVHDTLVAKTDILLDYFQKLGIYATFFLEIEEISRFRKDRVDGWELIEAQLSRIADEGHEIALHVHPQWIKAEYNETVGQYVVDDDAWKMDKVFQGNALTEYLSSRRQILSDLFTGLGHPVEILGFRAGGYNVGHIATNARYIRAANLVYDASAVSGCMSVGPFSEYDFSENTRPENYSSEAGVLASIPISSCFYNKLAYVSPALLKVGNRPKVRVAKSASKMSSLKKLQHILKVSRGPSDFVLLPFWLFTMAVLGVRRAGYVQVVGHNKSIISKRRVYLNLWVLSKLFDTRSTLRFEFESLASGRRG